MDDTPRAEAQRGVERDARHPGQLAVREDERQGIAKMARDLGVDEDVLQLAGPAAGQWPHPQARPPGAQPERRAGAEVSRRSAAAAVAGPGSKREQWLRELVCGCHFEYFIPTPGTNPTRQVQAVAAPALGHQLLESREVPAVEAGAVLGQRAVKPAERLRPHGWACLAKGTQRHRTGHRSGQPYGARLQLRLHPGGAESCTMETAGQPGPVRLQPRQELEAHADPGEAKVPVGGIPDGLHPPLRQVGLDLRPPAAEERPHERSAARGHAAHPGQAGAAEKVQQGALDKVVGGVAQGGGCQAGGGERLRQEAIAGGARRGLERTASQGSGAAAADELDPQLRAEASHLVRLLRRAGAECVVEVSGDDGDAGSAEPEEQGGGVRTTRNGDQHPVPIQETGGAETRDEAGGGGWVRTTDNTIMSRVLYH